ncbi:MAG: hypothetical protein U0931_18005 [Vulcanimicrobiota bacterium]
MLDEVIGKIVQEARANSSGVFTLDHLRREKSLQDLQAQQPWLYLTRLLQAGVALHTNKIEIHCNSEGLEVAFPVANLEVEHFQQVLSGKAQATDRAEAHLKAAFALLPLVEARNFEFELCDGQNLLRITRAEFRMSDAQGAPPRLRVRLQWMPVKFWKIWRRDEHCSRVRALLKTRFCLCPRPIFLNQQPVLPISPLQVIGPEVKSGGRHWCVAWAELAEPTQECAALLSPALTPVQDLRLFGQGELLFKGFSEPDRSNKLSAVLVLACKAASRLVRKDALRAISNEAIAAWLKESEAVLLSLRAINLEDQERSYARLAWAEGLGGYQIDNFDQCAVSDWSSAPSPPLRMRSLVMLPWLPGGSCRLYPVWDGALYEPVLLQDGLPGAAILSVRDDWEFDANHSRPVMNQTFDKEVKRAKELLDLSLRHLQDVFFHPAEAAYLNVDSQHLESWGCYFEV